MSVLSLFSGCGDMDIGFEGGFKCLKVSINGELHPDWIEAECGEWVAAFLIFDTLIFSKRRGGRPTIF